MSFFQIGDSLHKARELVREILIDNEGQIGTTDVATQLEARIHRLLTSMANGYVNEKFHCQILAISIFRTTF